MVKLKKQLAEKEKALGDEQEAHQAIQSKLKELRTELNVEKHTNRQLEETLNARQMDLQALNARLQALAEEKQNVSKQLQQVRLFSLVSQHSPVSSVSYKNFCTPFYAIVSSVKLDINFIDFIKCCYVNGEEITIS